MKEEDYGMWCRSWSDVGECVEESVVAGDLEGFEGRRIGLVVDGVSGDCGGELLVVQGERKEEGAEKRGGGEIAMKAHS
jgi:hypothetical protein